MTQRRHRRPTSPEELFEQNIGLVYYIARRHRVLDVHREDLIQEGMLALWRCCSSGNYDPERGTAFSTFAGRYIDNALSDYAKRTYNKSGLSAGKETLRKIARLRMDPDADIDRPDGWERLMPTALSRESILDAEMGFRREAEVSPVAEDDYPVEDEDAFASAMESLAKLPARDRVIVEAYYGINGWDAHTGPELAEMLGISESAVSLRRRKALGMLREAEEAKLK